MRTGDHLTLAPLPLDGAGWRVGTSLSEWNLQHVAGVCRSLAGAPEVWSWAYSFAETASRLQWTFLCPHLQHGGTASVGVFRGLCPPPYYSVSLDSLELSRCTIGRVSACLRPPLLLFSPHHAHFAHDTLSHLCFPRGVFLNCRQMLSPSRPRNPLIPLIPAPP